MSAIYWEQMLCTEWVYVSICTTKTCLLVFSSISNHNGVPFIAISYQFSGELHLSCYKTIHPERFLLGNEVFNDHFPGNHTRRPDSGTAGKVSRARTPVGCFTWELCLHIFRKIQKQQVLGMMATENLPLGRKEIKKNVRENKYCWIYCQWEDLKTKMHRGGKVKTKQTFFYFFFFEPLLLFFNGRQKGQKARDRRWW